MRLDFYFLNFVKGLSPSWQPMIGVLQGYKIGDDDNANSPRGMRVTEAYLNRAEANIRLFLKNGSDALRVSALADLNYLRSHRLHNRMWMWRLLTINCWNFV